MANSFTDSKHLTPALLDNLIVTPQCHPADWASTAIGSSTPSNLAPAVGFAFTPGATGAIEIQVSGDIEPPSGGVMILGARIRTGSTVGSGTLIAGGEEGDGIGSDIRVLGDPVDPDESDRMSECMRILSEDRYAGSSILLPLIGFTPGTTYNVAMYIYRVGSGNGTLRNSAVMVRNIPGLAVLSN